MDYAKIPNSILKNEELTDNDKFTYIILSSHRNEKTNQAFPNQETISKRFGISQTIISRSIQNLEKEGCLKISKKTKKGQYASNIYTFNISHDTKYTIVNIEIIDKYLAKEISVKELMFYVKLKRFVCDFTYKMTFTTKTEIAKIMNVDVKTVRKYLDSLNEKKIIKVESDEYTIDVELSFEKQILVFENVKQFNDDEIAEKIKKIIESKTGDCDEKNSYSAQ